MQFPAILTEACSKNSAAHFAVYADSLEDGGQDAAGWRRIAEWAAQGRMPLPNSFQTTGKDSTYILSASKPPERAGEFYVDCLPWPVFEKLVDGATYVKHGQFNSVYTYKGHIEALYSRIAAAWALCPDVPPPQAPWAWPDWMRAAYTKGIADAPQEKASSQEAPQKDKPNKKRRRTHG